MWGGAHSNLSHGVPNHVRKVGNIGPYACGGTLSLETDRIVDALPPVSGSAVNLCREFFESATFHACLAVIAMSGNAGQLITLLVTERSRLLRYLARYLDAPSAEDTLQAMYFRVAAVPDEPPIRNARHYLYRLARNHAIDHGRGEARQRRMCEGVALLMDETGIDAAAIAGARAELAQVMAAARGLPEPGKSMLRLNRFEGLTQREIAERFGVSTTTVEKHIQRALRRLDAARER